MFFFLESNRDNLKQMRKEIADIQEKLDSLMKEEKKLRMEGKIYFFSGDRIASLSHEKVNWVNGIIYLFLGMIFIFGFTKKSHISAYENCQLSWKTFLQLVRNRASSRSLSWTIKLFFELCFMVTVIYYSAATLTEAGNIPLFLPDNWKLNISEIRNISENFFNKLKIEKSINR